MFLKGQMKGFVVGVIITLVLTSVTFAAFAAGNLIQIQVSFDAVKKIFVEDRELSFGNDSRPFIYNGKTYIALRPLFEQFDTKVSWDSKTGTVSVTSGGTPQAPQSDSDTAKLLERALMTYIAETNDVRLTLFGDAVDVDTILEKLQAPLIDPKDGNRYGPYLEQKNYPEEIKASTYYPKDSKGWEIVIDTKTLQVTVSPSGANSLKFVGQ